MLTNSHQLDPAERSKYKLVRDSQLDCHKRYVRGLTRVPMECVCRYGALMDLFFSFPFRDKAALCIAGEGEDPSSISLHEPYALDGPNNPVVLTLEGTQALEEMFDRNAPPAWRYCQHKHPLVGGITIGHYMLAVIEDAFGYGHASSASIQCLRVWMSCTILSESCLSRSNCLSLQTSLRLPLLPGLSFLTTKLVRHASLVAQLTAVLTARIAARIRKLAEEARIASEFWHKHLHPGSEDLENLMQVYDKKTKSKDYWMIRDDMPSRLHRASTVFRAQTMPDFSHLRCKPSVVYVGPQQIQHPVIRQRAPGEQFKQAGVLTEAKGGEEARDNKICISTPPHPDMLFDLTILKSTLMELFRDSVALEDIRGSREEPESWCSFQTFENIRELYTDKSEMSMQDRKNQQKVSATNLE